MLDFPPPSELLKQIHALTDQLPRDGLTAPKIKKLREDLEDLINKLQLLRSELDHIKQPAFVFNPADPEIVGTLIARTLLDQPLHPLGSLEAKRFYGSGVYAIYYKGDYDVYAPIKATSVPIYVGKADPDLLVADSPEQQGDNLWHRLVKDHAKNISLTTLNINDFDCRFLVVASAWQGMAELYLINRFKPVWNKEMKVCLGFGKHGDSPTTRGNSRSPWDALHPGREWATREGNKESRNTVDEIKAAITEHFRKHPPKDILFQPLHGPEVKGDTPLSASGESKPL
jgi:hypothetical protein